MGRADVTTGGSEVNVAPEDVEERPKPRGDTFRAFAIAVMVALGVRTFVLEPFKIPSGSMIPTLLVGDYILVNKFAYGVRLPFTGQEIIPIGTPSRGDVVVFRFPDDPKLDFIKRVVGIPGDTVERRGDRLWVNGQRVDQRPDGTFSYTEYGPRAVPQQKSANRFIERNAEGDEYTILRLSAQGDPQVVQKWIVPEGRYFMMGDNRDNSQDSTKWQNTFVTKDQLKGRAFLIHWSWVVDGGRSEDGFVADFLHTLFKVVTFQVDEIRWGRIGHRVDGLAD
jgi:signal peptidase I